MGTEAGSVAAHRRGAPAAANLGDEASASPRVLVVDDEPAVARVIARALRSHGFEVTTAQDGRAALRAVLGDGRSPHLLLTDVAMPNMTGVELAGRVRAARPSVRVVLMTGEPAFVAAALDRPELVQAVLAKPFGVDELLGVVRSALAAPAVGTGERSVEAGQ